VGVRVLVVGAGALGSLVAALLSEHNEVIAVARGVHQEEIARHGLRITGLTERTFRITAVRRTGDVPSEFHPEIVFVTVKSFDTAAACAELRELRPAVAVTMQNGLDNARHLESVAAEVIVALTSLGATLLQPGTVRHAGRGRTIVGASRGRRESASLVAQLLSKSGMPAEVTDDLARELWLKAAVNGGINPLTAIHRVANGALLEREEWTREMVEAAREVARVARAAGILVSEAEAEDRVREVARDTAANRSSMLQDIERGGRTEIEEISGAVLSEAKARGVPVPVTERLYAAVFQACSTRASSRGPGRT